jgi:acyl-CoA thioester hydrolase
VAEFVWPVRVYYEDTDAGGVVYHTGYIRYFERARTEWLRSLGHSQARWMEEEKLLFTVVRLEVNYRHSARLDDQLKVVCRARLAGGASVSFEQRVETLDGRILADGMVLVACVDAQRLRPRRLPSVLREVLV